MMNSCVEDKLSSLLYVFYIMMGGFIMGTEKEEILETLIKVELECGRKIVSLGKENVAGYDGSCETYTSNQTSATCC